MHRSACRQKRLVISCWPFFALAAPPGLPRQIVAFLESLTGEQPEIAYPTLLPSTDDTPQPDPTAGIEAERRPGAH